MRKLLNSFTAFTRAERAGLLVLSVILIVLIIVRTTMSLWVHPRVNKEQEEKLLTAWAAYKSDHMAGEHDFTVDSVNLNTADSFTLVALKGIGPVTAHNIIVRRREKGPFTTLEQLRETGSFPEETFAALKGRLYIDTSGEQRH